MREELLRQSFLGEYSDDVLAAAHVAIVGLGGGGSHVSQQLAHRATARNWRLVAIRVSDTPSWNMKFACGDASRSSPAAKIVTAADCTGPTAWVRRSSGCVRR